MPKKIEGKTKLTFQRLLASLRFGVNGLAFCIGAWPPDDKSSSMSLDFKYLENFEYKVAATTYTDKCNQDVHRLEERAATCGILF